MQIVREEDLLVITNFAAGVNKAFEQRHTYPIEYYLFWFDFEPWKPEDSVAVQYMFALFISSDWYYEMTRDRLLEIYSKDEVDKLLPFNIKNMWDFGDAQITIKDEDLPPQFLKKGSDIYSVPEELLNIRQHKKEKLETSTHYHDMSSYQFAFNVQGSNCWAVHG